MSRITVGVDGSAQARAALQFALEEAQLRGADVDVVLAYSPLPYLADDVVLRHERPSETEAEELLRKRSSPPPPPTRGSRSEPGRSWAGRRRP